METGIEVREVSNDNFSARVPLLEKKKADRVLKEVETYLLMIGNEGFQSSWCETKDGGQWFTEFSFRFRETKPGLKRVIGFAITQALKKEVN